MNIKRHSFRPLVSPLVLALMMNGGFTVGVLAEQSVPESGTSMPASVASMTGQKSMYDEAKLYNSTASNKPGAHGAEDPHALLTANKHIAVAMQHRAEGRMHEALMVLNQALLKFPENADILGVRGGFYLEMGEYSRSLSDTEAALAKQSDNPKLLNNRAQLYRQFGRIEESLKDLSRALELDPDLVAARFNRGAVYYSSGDFEMAIADFEHCIAVDPHTPAPYFNRASAFYQLGKTGDAVKDLHRFMELADNQQWKDTAQELLDQWDTASAEREG